MEFLFYSWVDVSPLTSGNGEGMQQRVEVEVECTHFNTVPHLQTESATVYINTGCEPYSAMCRCHIIEQLARLSGCLDTMQTHIALKVEKA